MRCKRRGYFTLKNRGNRGCDINFKTSPNISRNFSCSSHSAAEGCFFSVTVDGFRRTALFPFDFVRLFEFQ